MFDFRERRSPRWSVMLLMLVVGAALGAAGGAALLRLVNVEWPRRAELLSKQGWATMPDRPAPDPAVARLCALKLGEAYASVRQSAPIAP